jgi:hypothetical protein
MKIKKPLLLKADTISELHEKYVCAARKKFGMQPHISKATAKKLCATRPLPRIGYEITIAKTPYGDLVVQNLSGQFFVEAYCNVNRRILPCPKCRKEFML